MRDEDGEERKDFKRFTKYRMALRLVEHSTTPYSKYYDKRTLVTHQF